MELTMPGLDRALFALINGSWTSPGLDLLMSFATDDRLWGPFLLAGWLWLLLGSGGRQRALALVILVAAGSSDLISARLIKPLVGRTRPCCAEPGARLLLDCKGSPSFPSSHAANTTAVGVAVLLEAGPWAGVPVLAAAAVVSYSRVYVGVHYPLDVLGGMALGATLAALTVRLRRWWWPPAPDAGRPVAGGPGAGAGPGAPVA